MLRRLHIQRQMRERYNAEAGKIALKAVQVEDDERQAVVAEAEAKEAEIEARWQGMLARVCAWRDGHGGWSPLSDGRELVSEGRAVRIYAVCVCTAM